MASAPKTMSAFYKKTGTSKLGGNSRTRGKEAPISLVRSKNA